jgi:hypothetical protein
MGVLELVGMPGHFGNGFAPGRRSLDLFKSHHPAQMPRSPLLRNRLISGAFVASLHTITTKAHPADTTLDFSIQLKP